MNLIALLDCNNFFVSCERVFDPSLKEKPVIVLSNNDGCAIARSEEAKMLQITMGAPLFTWKHLIKKYDIKVFSPNFRLYCDFSRRIISILENYCSSLEVYSIDEAFLPLDTDIIGNPVNFMKRIRREIKKCLGIPVSIGIAKTKTLSKIANAIAKKCQYSEGVFELTDSKKIEKILAQFPVGDVWGIGSRHEALLRMHGIFTAQDFIRRDDTFIRKNFTITGLRTAYELKEMPCFSLENPEKRKNILSSRSFGRSVEKLTELEEAVAFHVSRAAEKLRTQKSLASVITVFIKTQTFKGTPQYKASKSIFLESPTSFTSDLIKAAHLGLRQIFKKYYCYKKAGVILSGFIPDDILQLNLFCDSDSFTIKRTLMKTIDNLNAKIGSDTIRFAASGLKRPWRMKQEYKSPNFTTSWSELLTIKI